MTDDDRDEDNDPRHSRWRLPVIVVGAVIGMLLWLLVDRIIPN